MSDFALAHASVQELLDYNVLVSKFESGYEQRRLKHGTAVIGWKFKSPNLTQTGMKTYRDFFTGKYGALTNFTWTSPFDSTQYNVRFAVGSFQIMYQNSYFTVEWVFERLNL
jgi:phage-related protein